MADLGSGVGERGMIFTGQHGLDVIKLALPQFLF